MSKEFKIFKGQAHTRYVLESASAGATSSAAVTSNTAAVPGIRRRTGDNLLTPEAQQEKVPQKPRQGPLRPQTGAGAHKDKKRDQKQGKQKHKKPFYEDHEVSMANNELKSIYTDAKKLLTLLQKYGEQGDLEAWQQSKITKAADFLNSVVTSIGGEHDELDELKMDKATDQEKIDFFKMQADRFKKQGFAKAADQAHQQSKQYKKPQKVMELDKPSGKLYILVKADNTNNVRLLGAFANSPEEVEYMAQRQGIKDKSGTKMKALKINLLFTDAAQALEDLENIFRDIDFVGAEAAEFVFKNNVYAKNNKELDPVVADEVREFHSYIDSGDNPKMKMYQSVDAGTEPEGKPKGVDHFVIGPDGKRRRVAMPGKPSAQMGGHAVEQPKTFIYTLQRTDLMPKLRSMGFKFDGNKIILSKQQRDQLVQKLGDKFQSIFGKAEKFTEEEGSSYQTDSMVSHISQIIGNIYPQGGDKNTYMKLVAREMPRIVQSDPKLFRRAFGIAYDRFFHIDQDDDNDNDYTDYSMRQGEKGMEEGVAGPKNCWPGHRKVGTKPGTGKNAGKRVNDCEKIKETDVDESGLQYHTGVKKHGKKYMDMAAAAGRRGASQEELGRLKDRYSKAYKKEDAYMESLWNQLYEKAPEGWEGTVKAMKKHKEIDNPYALTHWMKNKGYKSHKAKK